MPSTRRPNKVKTHVLKDCSLPSLLVPIDPHESDFTATKGAHLLFSLADMCKGCIVKGPRRCPG